MINTGSEIYYTQHTHSLTGEASAKMVKRASDRAVIADGIGDLRSNINDRLYLFVSGSNAAQEWAKTSSVSRSIDSLLSAANGLTTGYQPYQPYVRQSLLQQDSHGLVYRHVGDKQYELKDHLGNVRVVVSDRKNLNTTDGTLSAEVLSYNNYYPFGMLQPGRNFTGEHYRYGFQGQEKDDEVKGEGNAINYKFRLHDPRVGRFFSVDPLAAKYPHNSSYAFSENRVIDARELEGLESVDFREKINNGLEKIGTVFNSISYNKTLGKAQEQIDNSLAPNENIDLESDVENLELLKTFNEGSEELVLGIVGETGDLLDKSGNAISTTGYALAIPTEGASLALVPLGSGMSTVGKTMKVAVYLKVEDYKSTTSEALDMAFGVVSKGLLDEALDATKTIQNATSSQLKTTESILGSFKKACDEIFSTSKNKLLEDENR